MCTDLANRTAHGKPPSDVGGGPAIPQCSAVCKFGTPASSVQCKNGQKKLTDCTE